MTHVRAHIRERDLQHALVDRVGLPVSRHDQANATSGDIPEADVEPTELAAYMQVINIHLASQPPGRPTNHDEHPEWFLGVLNLRQEVRGKAERQCDLRRLVEVGLQDMPPFHVNNTTDAGNIGTPYLLNMRKLSSTWSSCLLGTDFRILS